MHDRARGNYTHLYTFNRSTPSSPRWFGRLGHVLLVVSSPDQIDNQVAGYATVYAPPNAAHPFQFITVKGSGHMVRHAGVTAVVSFARPLTSESTCFNDTRCCALLSWF